MESKILYVAIAMMSCFCAFAAKDKRPNIVYIMTDDHSYQTISAYGGALKDIVKTPNMDSIANDGMLFNRCYVGNSLCGPCRATVLTGKHSHANGFYANTEGQVFDGSQLTFPKVLQKNGYQTAIVGKWHLVSNPTGFDYWEVLPCQGIYYNPEFITMDGKTVVREGYSSDIIVDRALNWLDNDRDKKKPFMMMVHFKGIHCPWEPSPRDLHAFDNVKFPVPDTYFDDYSTRGYSAKHCELRIDEWIGDRIASKKYPMKMNAEQKKMWDAAYSEKNKEFYKECADPREQSLKMYQRYMQDYCATVLGVDDNIGRLLKYLKENGLEENTVVIYTSDQGFYMGEHGWFDKRFMYEESFRTPLMIKWPNHIKGGQKTDSMVQNIDFAETILDIAGCKIPEEMQGLSFKELLLTGKEPKDWRKSLYYRYYEWPSWHMVMRHDGVIMGNEKLLHFYPIDEYEYYDLLEDPNELQNKIDNPKYAERIAILKSELNRLKKFYNAPDYDKDPYMLDFMKEGISNLKRGIDPRGEKAKMYRTK